MGAPYTDIWCQRVIDLLVDYLEGDLSADLRATIDGHLAHCACCEEFIAEYQQATEICRAALRRQMPDELRDRLLTFLGGEIGAA